MHELSIAMNILEVAQEAAERHGGGRVTALHLKLGPLSGVVKEALVFAYELASTNSPFDGSRLVIDEVPIVVYCPTCQARRLLESMQDFSCPVCHTPTGDVVEGREMELVALEIEE